VKLKSLFILAIVWTAAGCSNTGSPTAETYHVPLQFVDGGVGAESVKEQSVAGIGTIYLEQQFASPIVNGLSLQASGVDTKDSNVYVTYSYRDPSGVKKMGAIDRFGTYACATLLSYTGYCFASGGRLAIPKANIYSTATDGTNLYAVGSTTDEASAPFYGRLYKISLNGLGDPQAILSSAVLPSYTGTSVALSSGKVLTTFGTSTSSAMMGGFKTFNASSLAPLNTQTIYDARSVAVDPSNANQAFIVTGAGNGNSAGRTLKVNSDASGSTLATFSSGGNTIAESRSDVIVGDTLVVSSAGDGGLSVMCKATGQVIATKGAPTGVGSIPNSLTVTNGVAAVPGFLFAANGEAGVYVYTFNKSSAQNSNYCQGVTLTLVGRLALSADSTATKYINAELSANSLKAVTVLNVQNIVTSRLLIVASGNKGVSLLNLTSLNLNPLAVDDF
jgi:hypothetical protein